MSDELTLWELAAELRRSLGILHKRDIQTAADRLGALVGSTHQEPIRLGDDCAAIPDGEGYLLLAAEGMWPTLVDTDPWFAGWCAVMVNVSDIYAMGGRPIAVVDTVWSQSPEAVEPLWQGMVAASQAFNVPIVGGHTRVELTACSPVLRPSRGMCCCMWSIGRAKCTLTIPFGMRRRIAMPERIPARIAIACAAI